MRKSIYLLSIALMSGMMAEAKSLSPAEALSRAAGQLVLRTSRSAATPAPVMTVGTSESPALYVFNQPDDGWVILSADDVAAPVIGFSDSGSIDPANLPENLRGWLDICKDQIIAASEDNAEPYSRSNGSDREPIAPLMSTLWNQDNPYNSLCPKVGGQRCVTGCVATAMAQVMKYHRWPETVADNVELVNKSTGVTLTEDFSNYRFKWDDMIDKYSDGYTDVQEEAVAKLMLACGFSVNMNYTPSVSGSYAVNVGNALVEYFKYDGGLHNEPREIHSTASWENMIYESLKNDGPVIYWGSGNGSHCFVCDGYRGNGYYHFNWGWGGLSDGYFLLNALAPGYTGIGANAGGFNYEQGVLLGIKKSTGAQTPRKYTFVIHEGMNGVFIEKGKLQMYGMFWNYSPFNVKGKFVYRIYRVDNDVESYLKSCTASLPFGSSGEVVDLYSNNYESVLEGVIPTELPDGTYHVYPAFELDGIEYTFQAPGGRPDGVVYVRENGIDTATLHESGNISIENLSTNGNLYIGHRFKVSGVAKFSEESEKNQPVIARLLRADGSIIGDGSTTNLKFSGEGTPFEFVSAWFTKSGLDAKIEPGEYTFALQAGMTTIASCQVTVAVNNDAADYRVAKLEVENANAVNSEDIVCTAYIEGLSGVVDENMKYKVNKSGSITPLLGPDEIPVFVTAGQTSVVKFSVKIPTYKNVLPGDRLVIKCWPASASEYDNEKMRRVEVTVADLSGIEDIEADGTDAPVEYFNLQGVKVDCETLAPGIYIRRQGDKTTKVIVK